MFVPFTQFESAGGQLASYYPHHFLYHHTTLEECDTTSVFKSYLNLLQIVTYLAMSEIRSKVV